MKVAHVITGLFTGGAEAMLYRLVIASRAIGLQASVVSLLEEGPYGERLRADGVPVASLGMRRGIPDPVALGRLAQRLRRDRPDVVQGWMYHANLLAGLAGAAARVPVVWGIHHADIDPRKSKRLSHWTNAICARLSGVLPARIVCCAESAMVAHRGLGYRADRMIVIPNGFDVVAFARDEPAGAAIREELSIPVGAPVVGLVARLHPDKDHDNFLAAARIVADHRRDVVFVLAGADVEWSNAALVARVERLGLRPHMRLLGVRGDVPALLSAMDVFALSSRSEAFPLAVGEAMSCAVPCAVTDCGDTRALVGATGRVARPGDPAALAGAILGLLEMPPGARAALGAAARARVRQEYDLRSVVGRYASLYEQVVAGRGARAA